MEDLHYGFVQFFQKSKRVIKQVEQCAVTITAAPTAWNDKRGSVEQTVLLLDQEEDLS